jgi:cytoplasmic iron level regulating protein YaaA (DUF328/UPF0246 family)
MLLSSICSFSQKEGNSKIIIKLNDSVGIYNKVKYALVNSEFIVKDNGNKDTLTTYIQEYSGIFCKLTAIIESNTVKLSGVYGLKRIDEFGYTGNPKKYQDIIYYKGSQSWKLLRYVASLIGEDVSFSQ